MDFSFTNLIKTLPCHSKAPLVSADVPALCAPVSEVEHLVAELRARIAEDADEAGIAAVIDKLVELLMSQSQESPESKAVLVKQHSNMQAGLSELEVRHQKFTSKMTPREKRSYATPKRPRVRSCICGLNY